MIGQLLQAVASDLNAHLSKSRTQPLVTLSRLVNPDSSVPPGIEDKIVLLATGVEEDRTLLAASFPRPDLDTGIRHTPPTPLTLHVTFAALMRDYATAWDQVATIIAYFNAKSVFTGDAAPFPKEVQRVTFSLQPHDPAVLHQLWTRLGASYVPSVNYTVKILPVDT